MPADPAAFTRRVVALFDDIAATYDDQLARFYPFAADRLIHWLAPRAGEKILDVATGTGHAALAAAQAVGPGGRVHAIDLSRTMLERFDAKLRKFGTANVDVFDMDANAPDFKGDYFHHIVCSHGLTFMPDPDAALAQWRRVLRPGGTLALAVFSPAALRPLLDRLLDALVRRGVDAAGKRMFQLRGSDDAAALKARLESTGFVDVEIHTEQLGFHLKNPAEWWELVDKSALRELIAPLSADARESLRDELAPALLGDMQPNGLWLDAETLFARARKPGAGQLYSRPG
jgi:arsenite methyltransferase